MRTFNPKQFFTIVENEKIGESKVQPTKEGTALIIQYLNNKYQANISAPVGSYSFKNIHGNGPDILKPLPHFVSIRDIPKINELISAARNQTGDYRQSFIFEGNKGHAIFMVYIREGDKEGILYSDSIGADPNIAQQINATTGIKVFYTPELRQADNYSCYTDALVFGRDTTGFNPETGQYKIKNLLHMLEEREEKISTGLSTVQLPNELLKTSQISAFVTDNIDMNKLPQKIHKNETVDDFRERYSKDMSMPDGETKKISVYLHTKGHKYKDIMEIQFYLNEIEKNLGHALAEDIKKDFIKNAKNAIKNRMLYDFSEKFLMESAGYDKRSPSVIEVVASQANKVKSDNLDPKALAKKYNLPSSEFTSYLEQLTKQFDESFDDDARFMNTRWYSEEQEAIFSSLINGDRGLASTEFLLQTRPKCFTGEICAVLIDKAANPHCDKAASEPNDAGNFNSAYARLVLDNETIINQLAQRGELYLLGQKDAWFAKRLLNDYPHLLDENEKNALQWEVDHRSKSSSYSAELLRTPSNIDSDLDAHSKPDVQSTAVPTSVQLQRKMKELLQGIKESNEINPNDSDIDQKRTFLDRFR